MITTSHTSSSSATSARLVISFFESSTARKALISGKNVNYACARHARARRSYDFRHPADNRARESAFDDDDVTRTPTGAADYLPIGVLKLDFAQDAAHTPENAGQQREISRRFCTTRIFLPAYARIVPFVADGGLRTERDGIGPFDASPAAGAPPRVTGAPPSMMRRRDGLAILAAHTEIVGLDMPFTPATNDSTWHFAGIYL